MLFSFTLCLFGMDVHVFLLVQKSCCLFLFDSVTSVPISLLTCIHFNSFILKTAQNANFKKNRTFNFYLYKIVKSHQELEKKALRKVTPMHHANKLAICPMSPNSNINIYTVKKTVLQMIEDHILRMLGNFHNKYA